jgi:hypothetical protein
MAGRLVEMKAGASNGFGFSATNGSDRTSTLNL